MKVFPTVVTVFMILLMVSYGFSKEVPGRVQALSAQNNATFLEAAQTSSVPGNVTTRFQADSLIYLEDYESGAPGWFSVDETDAGEKWHQDDWNAYGGSGLSWWMADTTLGNNGGYLSHWYQVLDTPDIPLSGSPVLTFQHRLKCEPPAGATPPYNGWDGVNVRISTDGGTTWTVLSNPTPAYTATSLYSFGYEFGEGPGIPGWAGDLSTWTAVTIDLSAYTGQTVKIRFAFASDPAYDTGDDPTMFGWQVDEIQVADGSNILYYNDGTQTDMVPQNWAPVGGDYWTIEVDNSAPSPTHKADANDPNTGTYHPNMIDSYISPYFWLPDTVTDAFLDFYLQGTYDDNNTFPDVDYFGAYVQVKGETVWRYVSNIEMDPNQPNYVYSSAPQLWQKFSESYSVGLVDLSPLLGDTIRVKFTFESDEDAPIGTALQVDDVIVWTTPSTLAPPTNLQATAGDGIVDLMWDEMNVSAGQHRFFVYDDGNFENGIHVTQGSADAGVYFSSPVEATIDTLWVWGSQYNTSTSAVLKVWEVSNGTINPNPTYTKNVTLTQSQWNVYDVSGENWTLTGDFVAGIEINVDISIALDETTIPSQHSWVNLNGWQTWKAVANANQFPDGEWGVRASVTYTASTNIAYNVYRRLESDPDYGSPIATGLSNALYQDSGVTNGETYCYVVTAVYAGQGESGHSNEVCGVTPQSNTIHEMSYDDGSPESYYNPQIGNYLAVKFNPGAYPQDVVKLKAYFQQGPGAAQFKIFDDDGANGLPGTELFTINEPNIQTGWNEVDVTGITISDGSFYVGLRYGPTTPDIGIDETPPIDDMSYIKVGSGSWEKLTTLGLNYDVMIRCLLDSALVSIAQKDPALIDHFQLLQNYPNPFNPSTSISFMVPAEMNGEKVILKVYDLLGREVTTLLNGILEPGVHQIQWNGKNAAGNQVTSGIYFYTVKAGDLVRTRKMILMR